MLVNSRHSRVYSKYKVEKFEKKLGKSQRPRMIEHTLTSEQKGLRSQTRPWYLGRYGSPKPCPKRDSSWNIGLDESRDYVPPG